MRDHAEVEAVRDRAYALVERLLSYRPLHISKYGAGSPPPRDMVLVHVSLQSVVAALAWAIGDPRAENISEEDAKAGYATLATFLDKCEAEITEWYSRI